MVGKGWAVARREVAWWGVGMGGGSILLNSSGVASDCSCGCVSHPFFFLRRLRACGGGLA